MAEQARSATAPPGPVAPASATPESAATTPGSASATPESTASRGASLRFAYVLGLAVQVFVWFLIFLAIAVAVGAGGHLTQFRYVGF